MISRSLHALVVSLACVLPLAGQASAQTSAPVDFNRDIRPILSDACFHCHGPDPAKRKAKLHFDTAEGAKHAIKAGDPDGSEMIRRVTSDDPKLRMPPPGATKALSPAQIGLLREWVKQGATWAPHWAFVAPKRPPLPAVSDKARPRSPIDHFVLAKLEAAGLAPSPAAEPHTLLRRLSFDLTGLPPTPDEVDAFVTGWNTSPAVRQETIEKAVDRLLASPRYGERMASRWLDGARYADTNGYQTDGERVMWRWRDIVIESFNANMPFDQFTLEQLAGDMLPNATLEQRIASGFNRNHRGNSEGGVIPEEYAAEYVVDRVDTTSTVWLGLTVGCAKCHSHKYDPVSQKEFYQLFAYFNNVPEKGKAIKYGNSRPWIKSPTREQVKKLQELKADLAAAQKAFAEVEPEITAERERMQKLAHAGVHLDPNWTFTRYLIGRFLLNELSASTPRKWLGKPKLVDDGDGKATHFDGRSHLNAGEFGGFGFFDKFSLGAWVKPANDKGGSILSKMGEDDRSEGYHLFVEKGRVHVQLVKRWLDDAIRVETIDAIPVGKWSHVFVTYDGLREAKGLRVYLDGQPVKLKVHLDDLNQNFTNKDPLRIAAGGTSRFVGALKDVQLHNDVVAPEIVAVIACPDTPRTIALTPAKDRTPIQERKWRQFALATSSTETIDTAQKRLFAAEKALERFEAAIPTTMVMEEMPTPRVTRVLLRGEYDKLGEAVTPGTPAALPPLAPGLPNNRLGFAKWLVQADHPLTSRVAVNRLWQMLFGAGLVKSVEDFGAQGDWPSHPELLDWLAVEFRENGWDTKKLLRTIVLSATYQQSSKASPASMRGDPENRLLSRGPRIRLPAEMIRDQALFASGLLVEKQGGPSVRPYQPAGLGKELGGDDDPQDKGAALYRRSLYTFWKRTVAPPGPTTFDAANRETCVVRESRTNTPLQALHLLNDVAYVEAARVLAQRVMREADTPDARLARAFRWATGRTPQPRELAVLRAGYDEHHRRYHKDRGEALKLLGVGESPRDTSRDVAELAAYTATCNLILNLDEAITKE
jgi:mono/diheme cytochrome c family protein